MRNEAEVRARLDELEEIGRENGTYTHDEITEFVSLLKKLDEFEKDCFGFRVLGGGGGG